MARLIPVMEMLSGADVETFKNLVWVAALIIGVLFLIGPRVSTPLTIAARALSALIAATAAFAAGNVAVVFYILAHITDPRWSVGRDATLESPEVSAGPFFEPVTNTLNDILSGLTGSVNDVIALKNAFLIMPGFIAAAGWALLLLVGLLVANRILSWLIERDRRAQLERNTRDLADIRAQLGLAPFQDTRIGAR